MKHLFRLVVQKAGWVTSITGVLAAASIYFTILLYMNLRPDIEELLPNTARSVVDMEQIIGRLVSSDNISILVFSEHPEASKQFVIDLAERLNQFPKDIVASVETNIQDALQFFGRRRALFIEKAELESIETYIRDRIAYERKLFNPLTIFEGTSARVPFYDFPALEKKYEKKASGYTKFPDGYYATPDEKIRTVIVGIPNVSKGVDGAKRLRAAIDQSIRDVNPNNYSEDIQLKFTGGMQDLLEEHASLLADLELATIIVVILTTLSMLWFFRSVRGTLSLVYALLVGTLWTFSLTYFTIGYLNANSAFLGAIVIGNGVNFGIIYLARYLEELRKRKGHLRATYFALSKTPKATLTAALAAGFAYGSLAFTEFRGFRQFGIIGLMGMVLCWISAYTVLPATLTLMDRIRPLAGRILRRPKKPPFFSNLVANAVTAFPRGISGFTVAASVLASIVLVGFDGDVIETNLENLRDKKSIESGSGYNSKYLHKIFSSYPHPLAIMGSSEEETLRLEKRFREQLKVPGTRVAAVTSVNDFIPRDLPEKIIILGRIKKLLSPKLLRELSPQDRTLVKEYLAEESFQVFTKQDLPKVIRAKLEERDGTMGKLILVEPFYGRTENFSDLNAFIKEIRETADSVRQGVPVAGQLAVSSDMVEAISKDGPIATALAFAAVIILVVILFQKPLSIFFVLVSLLLGVVWLGGILAFFDLKINFLNFIAFPITFGIGVDYGVNIFQRYRSEGSHNITEVIRYTGGAVGLASLTTIIGYGSLLLAGNQAFVSFGRIAVLGEITCLIAAILSLPAFIVLRRSPKKEPLGLAQSKASTS